MRFADVNSCVASETQSWVDVRGAGGGLFVRMGFFTAKIVGLSPMPELLTCGIHRRRDSLVGLQQLLGRSVLLGGRWRAVARDTYCGRGLFAERRWV